jgi:hypothetical protein
VPDEPSARISGFYCFTLNVGNKCKDQLDGVWARTRKVHVMTIWTTALIVGWLLIASSACCFSQETDDFSESALTREQWQQRVKDARRRSEEFVATARMQAAIPPPSEKEEAEATDQRALNDPTLQQGDIVATSKGFVVFVGRDEEHQPNDFLPAPKSQNPP